MVHVQVRVLLLRVRVKDRLMYYLLRHHPFGILSKLIMIIVRTITSLRIMVLHMFTSMYMEIIGKPSGDSRLSVAQAGMAKLRQDNVTLTDIYGVLSTYPVASDGTDYTTLMDPASGFLSTMVIISHFSRSSRASYI